MPRFSPQRDSSWDRPRGDAATLDLAGRNAIVVGGTGGLGRAISQALAARGARVVVVGQTFRDADLRGIEFVKADLSLMSEARRVARALPAESADLVVFTTGIFAAPERQATSEGIERDLAVSFLNRHVMLRELAPRLGKERREKPMKPRVFIMGFPGVGQAGAPEDLNSERSYAAMSAHMNTVAGNEALVLDAAERYEGATFFGLNPGLHKTNIRSNSWSANPLRYRLAEWLIGLLTSTPETYAEGILPLLVSPEIESRSGAMFDQKGNPIRASAAMTQERVAALMAASDALAGRATGAPSAEIREARRAPLG